MLHARDDCSTCELYSHSHRLQHLRQILRRRMCALPSAVLPGPAGGGLSYCSPGPLTAALASHLHRRAGHSLGPAPKPSKTPCDLGSLWLWLSLLHRWMMKLGQCAAQGPGVPALQRHPLLTCVGQQYWPHAQKIISSLLKIQAASCYAETMKSFTKNENVQPNQNKQGFGCFFFFTLF